jgi:hypothetical protein
VQRNSDNFPPSSMHPTALATDFPKMKSEFSEKYPSAEVNFRHCLYLASPANMYFCFPPKGLWGAMLPPLVFRRNVSVRDRGSSTQTTAVRRISHFQGTCHAQRVRFCGNGRGTAQLEAGPSVARQ